MFIIKTQKSSDVEMIKNWASENDESILDNEVFQLDSIDKNVFLNTYIITINSGFSYMFCLEFITEAFQKNFEYDNETGDYILDLTK